MILDDFLSDFDNAREYADNAHYQDFRNVDGVVYPGICTDLPEWIRGEVLAFMAVYLGREPVKPTIFMRLSPKGVEAPHQAHTDALMGDWSLMLYLNRPEHCRGGTSLLRHREAGMYTTPTDPDLVEIWERDTNDREAWDVTDLAVMKPNRAFVFSADLFHRAEPIGGFGSTPEDARMVLTGFFS